MIDIKQISDCIWEDIYHWNAPDYCDAHIVSCLIDNRQATEEELEEINESDYKYDLLISYLY